MNNTAIPYNFINHTKDALQLMKEKRESNNQICHKTKEIAKITDY